MIDKISFREFFSFIRTIKNPEMEQNCYFLPPVVSTIIENENTYTAVGENAAIILQKDEPLYRLYYYARNRCAFSEVVSLLGDKKTLPIVCDVILEDKDQSLINELEKAGIKYYTAFIHMHCDSESIPVVKPDEDLSSVSLAKIDDAQTIRALIASTFDVWSAHFPTVDEVAEAIDKKLIYAVYDGDKLASFAWFDNLGAKKSLLCFIIVDEIYRGRRYGTQMVHKKILDSPGVTNYELWIEDTNLLGRKQHLKNGYVVDKKIDYIFTLSK